MPIRDKKWISQLTENGTTHFNVGLIILINRKTPSKIAKPYVSEYCSRYTYLQPTVKGGAKRINKNYD